MITKKVWSCANKASPVERVLSLVVRKQGFPFL